MVAPKTHALPDAIGLEVLRHGLESIAEEMNAALMRAAYSTNITDRRDSSCAVFLPDGEPVAQSESGTPLHLGVLPVVVRSILSRHPIGTMAEGDQFLMNTPYPAGPGHLNDITLAEPVFLAGRPVAIVAGQAHHVDVGGMVPGSMPANSTEIFQEGLQIPPVRLYRAGVLNEDVLDLFLANIRTPAVSRGDLLAQVAANTVGRRRVLELVGRWGAAGLDAAMRALLVQAERRMRAVIAALPGGEYYAEDVLDPPQGRRVIRVTLRIAGDSITADFTGTDPQVAGPINCRPPTLQACLAYVTVATLDPGVSPNAGTLRPLGVVAPEGTLVNARHPASIVHSNIVTTQRICDVLLAALHQAAPARGIAACSGTQNMLLLGGRDPIRDEPFTYAETHGGGMGAMHDTDGQSGVHTHMTNTLNSPAEVLEGSFPFRVLEYALESDSEGAGRHRGGFGMRKSIQIDVPGTLTIAADRLITTPWGLEGGHNATPARLELVREGETRALHHSGTLQVEPGDVFTLVTPGGGGWGDPLERDPAAVDADVAAGLVSPDRARDIYGRAGRDAG